MALVALGGAVVGFSVFVYFRRRWLEAAARFADAEIQKRGHRYRWTEHDDALRQRTEARRQHADAIKKDARQIEAGGHTRRIRMVR